MSLDVYLTAMRKTEVYFESNRATCYTAPKVTPEMWRFRRERNRLARMEQQSASV